MCQVGTPEEIYRLKRSLKVVEYLGDNTMQRKHREKTVLLKVQ
jgi:ABC-type Fe3+/spermidine/putrescine transport system ATPase subunit